ncbi:snf2 family domain-containing protein [Apiospora sp. TS-2023a]
MNTNDQDQFANASGWLFQNPCIAAADSDFSLLPGLFPPLAQGYDSLTGFDLNITDESYFEPQQYEVYGEGHHTTNQTIDLQSNSFTDSRVSRICFGSIPDIRTRIRTTSIKPMSHEDIVSLAISPIASYYGMEYSGTLFAKISKTNCAVIKQLYGFQNIQLRAFVPYTVLVNALSSHSEKNPATLKVDINVYGNREQAYSAGKTLSSGGLMLQQPIHGLEGVKYYNPHFLHIRECEGNHVEETPQYDLMLSQGTHSEEQNFRRSAEGVTIRDTEIETIFNGLTHAQQLQKRAADRGVRTILQDHQKEAIDFILRRESSPLLPELQLWVEHETDAGDIVYQHVITGTRRAEPLEAQGGILADEMGLGKTIVTLAVISSTLDEASAHAMEYDVSLDATSQRQRSKATLVIAPSSSHDIRNRNTRQFQVAAGLAAQYRWCLTGTPIQNSLEDLGALIAFLRVPLLENPLTFQRFIVNQSKQGAKYRFQNLRTLLESVCLRRTKEIIGLADPVQETRVLTFTTAERDQYNELLRKYEALIDMGVSGHSKKRTSTAKVQSFLKLRLFCNIGLEAASVLSHGLDPDEVLTYLQQIDEAVCVYCDSTIFTINDVPGTDGGHILAGCSHLACRDCHVHRHTKDANCPKCVENKGQSALEFADRDEAQATEMRKRPFIPNERYPTKLLAFVGDIEQQRSHKSIVFSSWTKTLTLVCRLLESRGMSYFLVHGGLSLSERHRRLDAFQSPAEANILLMTLGTGAVGLNLAAASRIYLLEPQWNPSVEQQAFGRALRLGQTEQVTITRYIMKDTVEDSNVQNRQLNKLQLSVGGFRKGKRPADGQQ